MKTSVDQYCINVTDLEKSVHCGGVIEVLEKRRE